MTRKLLSKADIPVIQYVCPCGSTAEICRFALLCENCLHPCKSLPPEVEIGDPQKTLRGMIAYAKFRRKHRRCFDCIYIKPVFIDVECTNKTMKKKV